MDEKKGFREFLCSSAGKYAMIAVFYVVILMLVLGTVNFMERFEYIGLVYAAVFGFFGWKSLTKIQPNIFLIMPVVGWVIYFFVKSVLAVLVGIFTTPFYLAKKVQTAVQKSYLNRG